jgi:methionine synthase II (cobalamin-independent)
MATEPDALIDSPGEHVTANQTAREVHLVGSAAFASADETFEQFGRYLGSCARRFPDGETGERKNWIMWQDRVLANNPQFERVGTRVDPRNPDAPFKLYRLRPGIEPRDIRFGALGYAEEARKSFATFKAKVAAGVLPSESRLLVSLPTPLVFNWAFLPDPKDQERVEPAYEQAMLREVAAIDGDIPRSRLAIQWDIAAEMTALERGAWVGPKTGHEPGMVRDFGDMVGAFSERCVRLTNSVPEGVELAVHLCYGDFGHRHSIEPSSLALCVEMANRITAGTHRTIQLIHMPVPRDRSDDAYFEPLRRLKLKPETTLSLGLVHHSDGVEGTLRRMATADRFVSRYSIATECGMGRRPPETMQRLLEIHAQVALSYR